MTTDDTVSTGNGFDTRPRYGIGECDCCGGAHFTGSCHVDVARHAALVAAARALVYDYELTGDEPPPDDEWDPLFLALRAALAGEELVHP